MLRSAILSVLLATVALCAADAVKDPNEGKIMDPTSATMMTTESGTKYHTKDCKSGKIAYLMSQCIIEGDTPCATCKPPVYDPATIVVFTASDAGKKYHLFSCKFAKVESTLAKATAAGLTPCAICKAPALWEAPKSATGAAVKP